MVYYRYLFHDMEELSPNEGIVYSALLSHSLMVAENFDIDGSFSAVNAKAYIYEKAEQGGVECTDYYPVSINKLSKHLEMTRNSVRRIMRDLETKHRLLGKDIIVCPIELLDEGYINLPSGTKLKGQQLVFYGLLKDRGSQYNGVIDTWAYRLAELAGITKKNAHDLLSILGKKGFVKRLPNGKLKIK